jgi:hypothetical protein
MVKFNKEELNALGVIVSNASISGKDSFFIASLLNKLNKMVEETSNEQVVEKSDEKLIVE